MNELCNNFIKDIMLQKFINTDYTRIIILDYISSLDTFTNIINKNEILTYIYRVYSDYPELAKRNPYSKINSIHNYGKSDIKFIYDQAIEDWNLYQENNSLFNDELYLYINVDIESGVELLKAVSNVLSMFKSRYCSIDFDKPKIFNQNDFDPEFNLSQGIYRNRVFEDMQYCPLCEEIRTSKLFAINIIDYCLCNEIERIDKDNGLIMCKEHAISYKKGEFYFDARGKVKNVCSTIVNNKMHLSKMIRTIKRERYLAKHYDIINKNIKETKDDN